MMARMECPDCGAWNDDSSQQFCGECGALLNDGGGQAS